VKDNGGEKMSRQNAELHVAPEPPVTIFSFSF
jgi:hypothetical protein